MTDLEWRDFFVRDAELRVRGQRAALARATRRGTLDRVNRGVYAPPIDRALPKHDIAEHEHLNRIRAVLLVERDPPVFSHQSAALLWKLPTIEPWPSRIHVVSGSAAGGRSTTLIARHGVDPGEVHQLGEFFATSLARTVVDVARASTFREGVAIADAALHGLTGDGGRIIRKPLNKAELFAELVAAGSGRGVAQARAVIEFADGDSGSTGESCSRVGFKVARLPAPILQQPFYDRHGLIGFTDFWWRGFNLMGEFDGASKYSDPAFLRGRTPEQALADEKRREDRLRAPGRGMSRWGWSMALSPARLRAHLLEAGLR